MIEALLKAEPSAVDCILQDAVGCIVTADEHDRLKVFDGEYGWERYRKAGLEVQDMVTHKRMI